MIASHSHPCDACSDNRIGRRFCEPCQGLGEITGTEDRCSYEDDAGPCQIVAAAIRREAEEDAAGRAMPVFGSFDIAAEIAMHSAAQAMLRKARAR